MPANFRDMPLQLNHGRNLIVDPYSKGPGSLFRVFRSFRFPFFLKGFAGLLFDIFPGISGFGHITTFPAIRPILQFRCIMLSLKYMSVDAILLI